MRRTVHCSVRFDFDLFLCAFESWIVWWQSNLCALSLVIPRVRIYIIHFLRNGGYDRLYWFVAGCKIYVLRQNAGTTGQNAKFIEFESHRVFMGWRMSKQAQCCFISLLGGPNSQVYLCRVRKEIRIMSIATHHKLLISKNYLNDIASIN